MRTCGFFLYLSFLFLYSYGDSGDYSDSESVGMNSEYPSLFSWPNATVEVFTAHSLLGGTTDHVFITLIGDLTLSGPIKMNNGVALVAGERQRFNVTLTRQIGILKRVILENHGIDGWLMSSMKIRINDRSYTLDGKSQWLDTKHPDEDRFKWADGYESNAHEEIVAFPTLIWDVTGIVQLLALSGEREFGY
jgi:hypothetical protein